MMQLKVIIVGLTLLGSAYAKDSLYVLVTAKANQIPVFSCSLRPESQPPKIENDVMKFRAVVSGYIGPLTWRIPIYQGQNGETDIAVNRIGSLTPEPDGTFPIELGSDDVIKASAKEKLYMQVKASTGEVAFCDTSLAAPRRATASLPDRNLLMVNGEVGP